MPPTMRIAVVVMASLLGLSALPALGEEPIVQIPCTDPRGCPDLLVDTPSLAAGGLWVQNFDESHCAVQEGMVKPGQRTLLRFTFNTPNVGAGDLIVGRPQDHPEWFEYHPCHAHYHFRQYADYRLWTPEGFEAWHALREADPDASASQVLAEHPELQSAFVAGFKMGFCVMDIAPALPNQYGTVVPEAVPRYRDCSRNQGITRGWADIYRFNLDGQWIDVTEVEHGTYVLEAEVNAERLYVEEGYANNRAWLTAVV